MRRLELFPALQARYREFSADAGACALTGRPSALARSAEGFPLA